jgi:hypothetical protein
VHTIDVCNQSDREAVVRGLEGRHQETARTLLLATASRVIEHHGKGAEAAEVKGIKSTSSLSQYTPVTPWGAVVDGAQLLDELVELVERYCILGPGAVVAVALWVLFAWAHDAFLVSPILGITSPTKRCGKTQLMEVLTVCTPFPLSTSNISPAVMYRVIDRLVCDHGRPPTILYDEADTSLPDRTELRGIINGGHRRPLATVWRCTGDDFEPKAFPIWGPKCIAMIGRLPDTTDDRAIPILMRRRMPHETVADIRFDRLHADSEVLRRKAARWSTDTLTALRDLDPTVPRGLNDRQAANWRPLLAIAEMARDKWPERALQAAVHLSVPVFDDATVDIQLLADLRSIFAELGHPNHLRTTVVIERLRALEDRPWREWARGKGLSPHALSRILGRFGVRPGPFRDATGVAKGYSIPALAEVWQRYLDLDPSSQSVTSVTSPQGTGLRGSDSVTVNDDVPHREQRNSAVAQDVTDVTDWQPSDGQRTTPPRIDADDAVDLAARRAELQASGGAAKGKESRYGPGDRGQMQPAPSHSAPLEQLGAHPCGCCGKFHFSQPATTCFWCRQREALQ